MKLITVIFGFDNSASDFCHSMKSTKELHGIVGNEFLKGCKCIMYN